MPDPRAEWETVAARRRHGCLLAGRGVAPPRRAESLAPKVVEVAM